MFTWFRKATAAFLGSGLTALGAAAIPGSDGGATITTNEWSGILATAIVAFTAVFFTSKNAPRNTDSVE